MGRMKGMTPRKLAEVCGGTYTGPEDQGGQELTCLVTDNRQIQAGGMFVAIRGERVDGNRFIPSAYEAGALCCLSENATEDSTKPYIQVASCLQALKDMAAYYRMQYPVKVIGVTGSVGKTTTKEMLASVLSEHYVVHKTQRNFNNEIGVPITLFALREEHEVAIVEMGISDFGEMSRLTAIAKPDLCVITNIGQCHLEQLGDLDGVLRAKTEIFEGLSEQGKAYLNGDDEKLITVQDVHGRKPVFFGTGQQNTVYPKNMISKGLAGTDFELITADGVIPVHVPVPGRHMVINSLAAAAIGRDLGLSLEEIARGIAAFRPVEGHGSILETDRFTIMYDCYNANPVSMKAGFDVLAEASGRKIAIIGDMFELGEQEQQMHFDTGVYAAGKDLDLIVAIGDLAKQYEAGIRSVNPAQNLHYFATKEEAVEQLPSLLDSGDSILVKASHGMHLEKVVAFLQEI